MIRVKTYILFLIIVLFWTTGVEGQSMEERMFFKEMQSCTEAVCTSCDTPRTVECNIALSKDTVHIRGKAYHKFTFNQADTERVDGYLRMEGEKVYFLHAYYKTPTEYTGGVFGDIEREIKFLDFNPSYSAYWYVHDIKPLDSYFLRLLRPKYSSEVDDTTYMVQCLASKKSLDISHYYPYYDCHKMIVSKKYGIMKLILWGPGDEKYVCETKEIERE